MRLIDADNYKGKVIASHCYSGVNKLINVDDVPTAYDVDKVVEKLKQKMKRARDKEQENTSEYFEGEADGFEFAIEIVKAGGND